MIKMRRITYDSVGDVRRLSVLENALEDSNEFVDDLIVRRFLTKIAKSAELLDDLNLDKLRRIMNPL